VEFVFWCHLFSVSNTMLKGTLLLANCIIFFSPQKLNNRKWEAIVIRNDYVLPCGKTNQIIGKAY